MRQALWQPGQCAFCALKTSNAKWSTPSVQLQWQRGARRHQSGDEKSNRGAWKSGSNSPGHVSRESKNIFSSYERHSADQKSNSAYGLFAELAWQQCKELKASLLNKDRKRALAWGLRSNYEIEREVVRFTRKVQDATRKAIKGRKVSKEENPLFYQLQQAFVKASVPGLAAEVEFRFMGFTLRGERSGQQTMDLQQKLANLGHPMEWYPGTRALQRTIHLHVGPTNSGKTYHALKRLEEADSGIYAGPLRLLAHEVYTRFNAKGKRCALITGEEFRVPEGGSISMRSCTVEMVSLNTNVDVAVIDEIQMMADDQRGWAWTQAFLAVKAKEVHLCGELRTVRLIKRLCATIGDKLIIHNYKRLSPLEPENTSLGGLHDLRPGDAIILFSRVAIHDMKRKVEKTTGKRCAVVYGSLPPETRAQQAALFNDPNNDYDYLVASDAIGMGLNLSVKRIVFEGTFKSDGLIYRRLDPSQIKQIAGRAGRYKTAQQAVKQGSSEATITQSPSEPVESKAASSVGYVTTLHAEDLPIVQDALDTKAAPLATAGIFPPSHIIIRFAALFPPTTPLSYIVLRLAELISVNPDFHLCTVREQVAVLDLIQPYKIPILDRITLMGAPVNLRSEKSISVVVEVAKCLMYHSGGDLVDFRSIDLELIDRDIHDHSGGVRAYLQEVEALHLSLTLYLWLSYRFSGIFRSQALAFHVKALVEEKIDQCLSEVAYTSRFNAERFQKQRLLQEKYDRARQLQEGFGNGAVEPNVNGEDPIEDGDSNVEEPMIDGKDKMRAGVSDAIAHNPVGFFSPNTNSPIPDGRNHLKSENATALV